MRYWKPEQPPPSTATRSISVLPSAAPSFARRLAALAARTMPSGAREATLKTGVDGSVDWTVLTAVYMRRGRAFAKGPLLQS